jgi:curli biogenesis system outer membrane secretion channel CsgG
MKRTAATLLVLALCAASMAAFAQKPRIAVLKIRNESQYGHGRLGPSIEDWLVEKLVQSGQFRVVERKELESILAEQELSLSGAVDDKTAVQVGKVLGCQLVVMGAVTDFSIRKSGGEAFFKLGVDVGKTTAEGTLSLRLVNTTTGEILYTGSESGSDSFGKVRIAGIGGGTDWDESQARKIFQPAVDRLSQRIVQSVEGLKEGLGSAALVSGKVAKVGDGKAYINLGSTDGIREGQQFGLFRVGETITDPDTGKILGQEKTRIGTLTVTKVVGEHLSIGVVDGGGQAQVGDVLE